MRLEIVAGIIFFVFMAFVAPQALWAILSTGVETTKAVGSVVIEVAETVDEACRETKSAILAPANESISGLDRPIDELAEVALKVVSESPCVKVRIK